MILNYFGTTVAALADSDGGAFEGIAFFCSNYFNIFIYFV